MLPAGDVDRPDAAALSKDDPGDANAHGAEIASFFPGLRFKTADEAGDLANGPFGRRLVDRIFVRPVIRPSAVNRAEDSFVPPTSIPPQYSCRT
jgi:hypothetical protein